MDKIAPGRYIVAVSGGVDSMVLLDMLRRQTGLELIVAHVNHGIRDDAYADWQLVHHFATQHGLEFVSTELHLPKNASEEQARTLRYNFLRQCCNQKNARAIITAHHQDDLIETALLAIVRGTGWRGLAPFVGSKDILRPLLSTPKHQLIGYARAHDIPWREDSTNTNETYLRNRIRHTLIPTLDHKSGSWRETFLQHIRKQQDMRRTIEDNLNRYVQKPTLARYNLITADSLVGYELLQQWLRVHTQSSLTKQLADAALLFAKVAKPHKIMPISRYWQLRATYDTLIVEPRPPVVSLKEQ